MDVNSTMMKVVKTMLLEASLKDLFSTIRGGNKIGIKTREGSEHAYEVESNIGGRIIMRDLSKDAMGTQYVMDRESLNKTDLTIWRYDSGAATDNFKGEEINMKVDNVGILNDKTGKLDKVEIEGEEDEYRETENLGRVEEYNEVIATLDKGDTIVITTETDTGEEGGDTIVNDLFFRVVGIDSNWYALKLEDVQGDAEGEVSGAMQRLASILNDNYIYIGGKHGFFKIRNDSVGIDFFIGKRNGKRLPIKGIIDVQNNDIQADIDYEDEDKKFTKKELQDYLKNDPTFQSMLRKKPSLWDALSGASPKGLMQLKNMVQKYGTKKSYLTKGKNIKFRVMSPSIKSGDFRHKLLNRKGTYYEAKVTGENTLKLGTIGKGHWEIVLDKEIEDNTYQSEISFCKADRTCNVITKDAIIKILTNG